VDAVDSRRLAVGRLVEPLAVGGLAARRAEAGCLNGTEERDAPGVDLVALASLFGARPFDMDDRAAVADQFAGQRLSHRLAEVLGRLDLLRDDERLLLGA